jgi:hypothetical protein
MYTSDMAENRVPYYVEDGDFTIEISENDRLFAVCANCKKVLYSAEKVDHTTMAVAEQTVVGHGMAYSHMVAVAERRPIL